MKVYGSFADFKMTVKDDIEETCVSMTMFQIFYSVTQSFLTDFASSVLGRNTMEFYRFYSCSYPFLSKHVIKLME